MRLRQSLGEDVSGRADIHRDRLLAHYVLATVRIK